MSLTGRRFWNLSVYSFQSLGEAHAAGGLEALRERFQRYLSENPLKGTVILAPEGVNCGIAGEPEAVRGFQTFLAEMLGRGDLEFKISESDVIPFRRTVVKIKKELVPLGYAAGAARDARTQARRAEPLEPAELKRWLDEGRPVRLIDTRNDYEVKYGTFKGAARFDIRHFREFPARAAALPEQWKREPAVMFCTGGIRCEKIADVMPELGFERIYQLHGGILKYFEECGGAHWDGDCYVFDERIALNPSLEASGVSQCRRCSSPLGGPLGPRHAGADSDGVEPADPDTERDGGLCPACQSA